MAHEIKTTTCGPITHWRFHSKACISLLRENMLHDMRNHRGIFMFMEGLLFSPVFPNHAALMAQLKNWLCNVTAFVYYCSVFFLQDTHAFNNEINWQNELLFYSSVVTLNCISRSDCWKGPYCISGLVILQQPQPPVKCACRLLQIWITFPNIESNIP